MKSILNIAAGLAALTAASPALAHGFAPVAGPAELFIAGLYAPAYKPVLSLLVPAAGLFAVLNGRASATAKHSAFALGLAAGLAMTAYHIPSSGWFVHLVALGATASVAAALPVSASAALAVLVIGGLAAGYATFADHAGEVLPIALGAGAAITPFLIFLAVNLIAKTAIALAGTRIGHMAIRIAASWLLAVTLMMLALGYKWNLLGG